MSAPRKANGETVSSERLVSTKLQCGDLNTRVAARATERSEVSRTVSHLFKSPERHSEPGKLLRNSVDRSRKCRYVLRFFVALLLIPQNLLRSTKTLRALHSLCSCKTPSGRSLITGASLCSAPALAFGPDVPNAHFVRVGLRQDAFRNTVASSGATASHSSRTNSRDEPEYDRSRKRTGTCLQGAYLRSVPTLNRSVL